MKSIFKLCLMAVVLLASACSPNPSATEEMNNHQPANAPKHVIVLGFDGLSASSINDGKALPDMAHMPNLRDLMANGSYTLQNRSVLPSSSAVNWASMWMGAGPELHGYTTWGSRIPDLPSRILTEHEIFPDIFAAVRDAHPEAEIGYIYEWEGMRYLADTLSINHAEQVALSGKDTEASIAPAVKYIKEKKPELGDTRIYRDGNPFG